MRRALLLPSLLLGACGLFGVDNGYAVDLTISSVGLPGSIAHEIRRLRLTVTGDETWAHDFPILGALAPEERFIYRPILSIAGHDTFDVTGLNGDSVALAYGRAEQVEIRPAATVTATLSLAAITPVYPDLLLGEDGAVTVDLPPALSDGSSRGDGGGDANGGDLALDLQTNCNDGVKDGDETDVDCGGSCPKCSNARHCLAPADCTSKSCIAGQSGLLCSQVASCPLCQVSDGTMCLPAAAGSDPKKDCTANLPACKAAACDGAGTCNAKVGSACNAPSCAAGIETDALCDAGGNCVASMKSCGVYACGAGACATSCTADKQCAGTAYCDPGASQCLPRPFAVSQPAQTGNNPLGLAAADVTADGLLDLIVAASPGASISVLAGKGDGSFTAQAPLTTGSTPESIAVADLNLDGKLDLAVAYAGSAQNGGVTILLGTGGGQFKTVQAVGVSGFGLSVVAGDWNRDGKPDLVVGTNGGAALFAGKGDGTFQPAASLSLPSVGIPGLAAADLNLDGKLDLVAGSNANNLYVLLGKGDGGFQAMTSVTTGAPPFSVAVADLNGDGKPDVVTTQPGPPGALGILLGDGMGNLTARPDLALPSARGVAVLDVNGDGKLDLAAGDSVDDSLYLFLGKGDGGFLSPSITALGAGGAPAMLAAGDWNGDGRPDLATSKGTSPTVDVLLNAYPPIANFSLAAARTYPTGTDPIALVLVDYPIGALQGDGMLDVVALDQTTEDLTLLQNVGAGVLQMATAPKPKLSTPLALLVSDFNRDGKPDLAVANPGNQTVSLACDTNYALAVSGGISSGPTGLAAGDLNNDGIPDLVTLPSSGNLLGVYYGKGDCTFSFASTGSFNAGMTPAGIALGDLNRDGKLDAVVVGDGGLAVLLGAAQGGFLGPRSAGISAKPHAVVLADWNGDGKLDAAAAAPSDGVVDVLLGGGDGSLVLVKPYFAGMGPFALAAADLNRDGHLDLAVANGNGPDISVLLGNGDGTFAKAVSFATGSFPGAIAAGDLDRDGRLDLAVTVANANGMTNNVSILINASK